MLMNREGRVLPSFPSRLLIAASSAVLVAACGGGSDGNFVALPPVGGQPAPAQPASPSCASLAGTTLADTTFTTAEDVPAGKFVTPTGATLNDVPAFCRLAATMKPIAESNIKVELWMPANWNGKFLGTGNGGAGGAIRYNDLAVGLRRGYAVANTDMGTGPDGVSTMVGKMEKVVDYGHRSTHLVTTLSKALLKQFYAAAPSRSYFMGCSTGGAQGVAEAIRYPKDYDGIVVGAMGHNRVPAHVAGLWAYAVTQQDMTTYFTPEKRKLWADKVMASCDAVDGLTDGVIGRPDKCTVDPAVLQCTSGDGPDCLSAGQVGALRKIYAGPSHSVTGEKIYPGFLRGTELSFSTAVPSPTSISEGGNFPFQWIWGTNWNWRTFDFGTDVDVMRNALNFAVDNTSGDLSAFKGRGGKMILFQGLADPVAAPEESLNYLQTVEKTLPGQSNQFVKLFNVPGMGHCRGGVGPNYFGNWSGGPAVPFPQKATDPTEDLLAAMEQWVENGRVPNEIIATKYAGNQPTGAVERTMPLCAWPKVSKYKGTGDVDSAASFSCVDPD
ncbi:tannase/feruloyl esterase family alpha/beta hydrolase [Variovorax sp. LjRoot290]|uniref:tannase/feruloyl esterase family alpha/beta hydrolase n=1 Tax=Variovorax sp. LjRoot290 TaxID=3342316 RepID=UPI003F50DE4D